MKIPDQGSLMFFSGTFGLVYSRDVKLTAEQIEVTKKYLKESCDITRYCNMCKLCKNGVCLIIIGINIPPIGMNIARKRYRSKLETFIKLHEHDADYQKSLDFETLKTKFEKLTSAQRIEITDDYCTYCGNKKPSNCMYDD